MSIQIRINESTVLRESFRVSDDTVTYAVMNPGGTFLGLLDIVQGKATMSSGIDVTEYDQVRAALPDVDFSLWKRS